MGALQWVQTSPTLIARLRDPQDAEAYAEFNRTYGRLILWTCMRHGLQLHDAEDASQLVLMNVRDAMVKGKYDRTKGKKFRNWLGTVIQRVAWDVRQKRRPISGIEGFGENLAGKLVSGRTLEGDDPTIPQIEWDRASLSCFLERALEIVRAEFPEKQVRAFEKTAIVREEGDDGRNYISLSLKPLPDSIGPVAAELGWNDQRVYKARNLVWVRLQEVVKALTEEDLWDWRNDEHSPDGPSA